MVGVKKYTRFLYLPTNRKLRGPNSSKPRQNKAHQGATHGKLDAKLPYTGNPGADTIHGEGIPGAIKWLT